MAEQILSQEEIDALLSAMAKGEIDLAKDTPKEPVVTTYDFTSKSIFLRDQFDALEEVYDKFCRVQEEHLSATLHRSFEVKSVLTEMVKFGDFMKAFSNPTNFNLFSMKPLIGTALMAVEPGLVFSLIDAMFGGDGKPVSQIRDFTPIEQRMMKRFATDVLKNMEKSWEIVYPISFQLKKVESKPDFVHMLVPSDLVIVAVFSITAPAFSGNIHFCYSYLMLDAIKDKLSSRYLREKDFEHSWNRELQRLLKDVNVTVTADLGRATKTIEDLVNLQVEDVIYLNTGPEHLIDIKIEDIVKFQGVPGIIKGNRAVQVAAVLNEQGGSIGNDPK